VAVLLVLGAFTYWWTEGKGRYLFIKRKWGVVEEGLIYRSGQLHERLIEDALVDHGIQVVVDLSEDEPDDEHEAAEREAVERLGIRKVDVLGLDGYGSGDLDGYAVALEEMVRATRERTPLLVHCAAGAQRTGGAVAFFRVLVQGWDGGRAYDEMMEYRREPDDRDRLLEYVNANMKTLAERLVERGVIDAVPDPLPQVGP
jgi:protein tyrosine/serine phosphatase